MDRSHAPGLKRGCAIALAAAASLLGFLALAIEAHESFGRSLRDGRGLAEATFLYLRFFTILTNIGLASLQGITAWRLWRGHRLPAAGLYDAALVYALVTGATYELLLRGLWSPRDWMFVSDAILHDVAPLLMLAVWLLALPRHGARWRDPLLVLTYPAAYLAMTLFAGRFGQGYPYGFLDVATLGFGNVLLVSLAFLLVFLGLAVLVTALARWRAGRGERPPRISP